MTRKRRKNKLMWVKEALDLATENWKDNWEQYEKQLRELVEEEFGKQSEEVWKSSVERPLEHVVSLVLKNHEKEWKKALDEKERKQVEKKQEIIYKNLREEIEDREWAKKVEEESSKSDPYRSGINIVNHSKKESQSLKKDRPPGLDLKDIKNIQVEIYSGEKSKIIGVSPQQIEKSEEKSETQTLDKEEETNQKLLNELLEKQTKLERLESKIKGLEKENAKLNLEKKVRELADQIKECKKSTKKNFKLYQKLMEKRIAENNNSYGENYLEKNRELESKVAELRKQKSELENQLAFLQKDEATVAKIEIPPKKHNLEYHNR
jgi:hypothetical protein